MPTITNLDGTPANLSPEDQAAVIAKAQAEAQPEPPTIINPYKGAQIQAEDGSAPDPVTAAAIRKQEGIVDPMLDMTPDQMVELARDNNNPTKFNILSALESRQEELSKDPAAVQRAADAWEKYRHSTGMGDLPNAGEMASNIGSFLSGLAQQAGTLLYNIPARAVSALADPTLQSDAYQKATRNAAEASNATRLALHGLGAKAINLFSGEGPQIENAPAWAAHIASHIPGLPEAVKQKLESVQKPEAVSKPGDRVTKLFSDLETAKQAQEIVKGNGPMGVPQDILDELSKKGFPVRPEEVEKMAAGDVVSTFLFGKAFGAVSEALPSVFTQAELQAAGHATASAAGKTLSATAAGAKFASKAAPVLPYAGAVKGAVEGGFGGAALGYGAGEIAARKIASWAPKLDTLADIGKQISGSTPVKSSFAQLAKDVAESAPAAAYELGKGAAADVAFAANAETPEEAKGVGLGTAFGLFGGGLRTGSHVLSGQIIGPRNYGTTKVVPTNGVFPTLAPLHDAAFNAAEPGVQARVNALRPIVRALFGDKPTELIYVPTPKQAPGLEIPGMPMIDAGTQIPGTGTAPVDPLVTALSQIKGTDGKNALTPEQAAFWANQSGLVSTDIGGKRLVLIRDIESAPHEAVGHVLENALGEGTMRQVDQMIQSDPKYQGRTWEAIAQTYAGRLGWDPQAGSWQDYILDKSGWGDMEAKEKVLRETVGDGPYTKDQAQQTWADSGNTNWRDALKTDQERAEIANRYVSREVFAENAAAAFEHGKSPDKAMTAKVARLVGHFVKALGGDPLADRMSKAAGFPLSFDVTQLTPKLLTGALEGRPTIEVPGTPGAPKVFAGVPVTQEQRDAEAASARDAAAGASDLIRQPGAQSERQVLGLTAEAIAGQSPTLINGYGSAPGDPSIAITSKRQVRRGIIEAWRGMPESAKSLVQRLFFPTRVIKTKAGGFQVEGWSPEVLSANAQKLAEWAHTNPVQLPSGVTLDPGTPSFTPESWQNIFGSLQKFAANQRGGRTGAGEPLVVPKEVQQSGGYAPPIRGGAEPVPQDMADFLNYLYNFKIPDTAIIRKGQVPINLRSQWISKATLPGRIDIPVEPRGAFGEYEGTSDNPETRAAMKARQQEAAQRLGIEGQPVMEVNPFRQSVEAAAKAAGVAAPDLFEVIQHLNAESIRNVEHAPEQAVPNIPGNTLTLAAGFNPPKAGQEKPLFTTDKELGFFPIGYKDTSVTPTLNTEAAKAVQAKGKVNLVYHGEPMARNLFAFGPNGENTGSAFSRLKDDGTMEVYYAHGKGGLEKTLRDELASQNAKESETPSAQFMHSLEGIKKLNDDEIARLARGADTETSRYSSYGGHPSSGLVLHSAKLRSTAFINPQEAQTFLKEYKGLKTQREKSDLIESYFGGPAAQFSPSSDPRGIKSAAVLDPETGDVFEGVAHYAAYTKAIEAGYTGDKLMGLKDGFVTNSGEFLNRADAKARAEELNQATVSPVRSGLASEDLKTQPEVQKFISDVLNTSPEAWRQAVSNPENGGALTKYAHRTGIAAKSPSDLAALRSAHEILSPMVGEAIKADNLDLALSLGSKTQALREAYEAASGRTMDGKTSMVDTIKMFHGADYEPPLAQFQAKTESGRELERKGFEFSEFGSGGERTIQINDRTGKKVAVITSTPGGPDTEKISSVHVLPTHQGQGIAETLYRELASRLQSEGITKLTGDTVHQAPVGIRTKLFENTKSTGPALQTGDGKFMLPVESTISPEAQFAAKQEDSDGFKKWAAGAPVVHAEESADSIKTGVPVVIEGYHGTTHDITTFDPEKTNVENDFGKAIYITNTATDAEHNYAGVGPDLTNRIERRAEQILNASPSDLTYGTVEYNRARAKAKRQATKELTENRGATMKVYAKLENPLKLGEGERRWDVEYPEEGEPTGALVDFATAIRDAASQYTDVEPNDLISKLLESESLTPSQAIEMARNSEDLLDAQHPETGDLALPEVIRSALERMGYDGIIDATVNTKFGSEKRVGNQMQGMHPDTYHAIVFRPEQIKSATGNRGTFDPSNPDVRFNPPKDKEWKLKAPGIGGGGFSKAWITPEGKPIQLGGTYHHVFMAENPKVRAKYKLPTPTDLATGGGEEIREAALKKGFARVNYGVSQGTLTIEARSADWPTLRPAVEALARANAGKLDSMTVHLFDKNVKNLVDSGTEQLFRYSDKEKMNHLPLISAPGDVTELSPQATPKSSTAQFSAPKEDRRSESPYFSQLSNVVDQKFTGASMPSDQLLSMLRNPQNGVKAEELKWSGLDDYLKDNPRVTKAQVQEYLKANAVQIKEYVHGASLSESSGGRGVSWENSVSKIGERDAGDDHYDTYKTNDGRFEIDHLTADDSYQINEASDDGFGEFVGDFGSREEVMQFLRGEREAPNEDYGGNSGTKFEQYQLPGGENYREVLLTLPEKGGGADVEAWWNDEGGANEATPFSELTPREREQAAARYQDEVGQYAEDGKTFTSGHWDEPNVVAHTRVNDRTDSAGFPGLFVEEIQSDWHQKGRKEGYKGNADTTGWTAKEGAGDPASGPVWEVRDASGHWIVGIPRERGTTAEDAIRRAVDSTRGPDANRVPDAPFKSTWHELAFRRMVRMAAEGGKEWMGWTTGEQQAERYDLSKHVDSISWGRESGELRAYKGDTEVIHQNGVTDENSLSNYIGKEATAKIIEQPMRGDTNEQWLEGENLKIGGEGMKGFYDKILVDYANKFGKKFGAKVEDRQVSGEHDASGNQPFTDRTKAVRILDGGGEIYATFKGHNEELVKDYNHLIELEQEHGGSFAKSYVLGDKQPANTVHSLPITPEMKRSVLENGVAQFSTFKDPAFDAELEKIRSGESGGQTFLPSGQVWTPPEKPSDIVSLASVNVPLGSLNRATVEKALAPYADLLDEPGVAAGMFAFSKDGKPMVSIDLNAIVDQKHRDNTLDFAKQNDQVAIWDAAAGKEVSSGGKGDTKLKSPGELIDALDTLRAGEPTDVAEIMRQNRESGGPQEEQLDLLGGKQALSSSQMGNMTKADLAARFPEAVIPRRRNQPISSDVLNSPLAKNSDAPVDTFARKLVEFAKEYQSHPSFQSGLKWYSEFVPQLKKLFGKDTPIMAELLAGTSPQQVPTANYAMALDAFQGFKAGRFDKNIAGFEKGLDKLKDGSWKRWLDREIAAGNVKNAPGTPTQDTFLNHWVAKNNLLPRQSNGKLFAISSDAVLKILARRWLENTSGLKTQNFVKNLLGIGHEATIDLWADRTMRRIGYSGSKERWRILPKNATGVSDADFLFAQKAFRKAAEQMGLSPDALQGGLWFAEKQLWADQGWGRLDLGDFRKEIKKTALLKSGIEQRLAAQKAAGKAKPITQIGLDMVEPRPSTE